MKKDKGWQYFICIHHDVETITKSKKIKRNGRQITISHTFNALKGTSVKVQHEKEATSKRKTSGGSGSDRLYKSNVKRLCTNLGNINNVTSSGDQNLTDVLIDNTELLMETHETIDQQQAQIEKLEKKNKEYEKQIQTLKNNKSLPLDSSSLTSK